MSNPNPPQPSRIITPVFRVSFPHVFTPQKPMDGDPDKKPRYGVMAVFTPAEIQKDPKEIVRWREMLRIADEASMKRFQMPLNKLPGNYKKPFHKGDEKAKYGFDATMVFTNITSHMKPGIVGPDGKTKILDAEGFYAGCYARASVNAYPYDNKGKGVAFGLNNLMFVRDGERLDNVTDAAVDFGDVAETDPFASTEDDLGLGF